MADIQERISSTGTKTYTARVRLKGYPTQTATFKRLTDAKKWIQDTESAIREGRHFKTSEAKKHTLAQAIDKYLADIAPTKFKPAELEKRNQILTRWKAEIGYCLLSELSPKHFVACRDAFAKNGGRNGSALGPASIRRHFVSISHVLKICQLEWHWIEQSPLKDGIIEMPELPRGIVRFLDNEELTRLTAACKESPNNLLYPAFILSVSTGMRQAETMNLYWREPAIAPKGTAWGVVNLADKCIILQQTKNGKRRRVPLAGEALAELQKLHKIRRLDSHLVFPSPTVPSKPIELKKAWTSALKAAEVTNFRWHDLRHTAASYLAQNGASLLDIAAVLGHSTLDMVQRYAHLSDGHISNVVASMNAKIFN